MLQAIRELAIECLINTTSKAWRSYLLKRFGRNPSIIQLGDLASELRSVKSGHLKPVMTPDGIFTLIRTSKTEL